MGDPEARRRLDTTLVDRGLAPSRARAQALIAAGLVTCDGEVANRPSRKIAEDASIAIVGDVHPYVSRGGVKLAHALDVFDVPVAGRVALDVGASTGGFTDVLLRRDAMRVHAVDVGHDQLDTSIRSDPRVVVRDGLNGRRLSTSDIGEAVGLIVVDVSFIGLRLVLPAVLALAAPGAYLVALIKPQFEVGRGRVGKGGVVRDPALHREVCDAIRDWIAAQDGWTVSGTVPSPIEGPDGNVEFLIAACLKDTD